MQSEWIVDWITPPPFRIWPRKKNSCSRNGTGAVREWERPAIWSRNRGDRKSGIIYFGFSILDNGGGAWKRTPVERLGMNFSWGEPFMSLKVGRGWGENLSARKKDLPISG